MWQLLVPRRGEQVYVISYVCVRERGKFYEEIYVKYSLHGKHPL